MRLGFVKFINARPLDYGFRNRRDIQWIEDTPARLSSMLRSGELDAALISSAECFRYHDILDYYDGVGVCAVDHVRSILYISPASAANENQLPGPPFAPDRLFLDRGSRSSSVLLQILFYNVMNVRPDVVEADPEAIPDLLGPGEGGLLIGDNALEFRERSDQNRFIQVDLASWWHEFTGGLPFVFALWAYPRSKPVPHGIFDESLNIGLENLEEIAGSSHYIDVLDYLKNTLHYRLTEDDKKALSLFKNYIMKLNAQ